jgi:hypothetical protein
VQQFSKSKPAIGVFFDSDFSTIDSVLAVALLHGLQGKNDCRVTMVSVSRPNLAVVGFIDTVERFYRGPAGNFAQVPPIGMPTSGEPGETSPAFTAPFEKKGVYKNEVRSIIETGDPSTLIRNYLQAQYDQNAVYVLGGPATNLAAALDFQPIPELLAAKVRYLVVSDAGLQADASASKKLFASWPTPIFVCGKEIGSELLFPGACIDKEFAEQVKDNPVADAYRAYRPMPYDAPSWSMAAALYAVRPKEGYFKLSGPQTLTLDPSEKERILKTYVELASAKPAPPKRFRPMDVVVEEPKDLEKKK